MKKILHISSGMLVWVLFSLSSGALLYANLFKDTEGSLRHFYIEDATFLGLLTGSLMLVLVLLHLGTFSFGQPNVRTISFDSEGGVVSIRVSAVEEFIRKIGEEFGAVISMTPRIRLKKELVSIDLDVKFQTGTRIPEVSQLLQDRVRESLREGLGILEVREVKVHIQEIVGAPPAPHRQHSYMKDSCAPELVIVGSIGIDTIETPREKRVEILGGSVSYACAAASFFVRTGMVGVVGTDFPDEHRTLWERMGIDLSGLQTEEGKTFRWSGIYEENMDNRRTLLTELNVLENFSPELPAVYCDAPYIFLGNIHPALQLHVLEQVHSPKFVLIDTMDLWINIARDKLVEVVGKCDMLTLNESEAELFTGAPSLDEAGRILLEMGPRFVLIKKGESGSLLVSREESFSIPAYTLDDFKDPTGAGDTFAGGLMGALAESGQIDEAAIRRAMVFGTVTAAFGVEEFSLDRLALLDRNQIDSRADAFRAACRIV